MYLRRYSLCILWITATAYIKKLTVFQGELLDICVEETHQILVSWKLLWKFSFCWSRSLAELGTTPSAHLGWTSTIFIQVFFLGHKMQKTFSSQLWCISTWLSRVSSQFGIPDASLVFDWCSLYSGTASRQEDLSCLLLPLPLVSG